MRDMKNCKNSKGLLTIKAFADKVGLSTHILRNYDNMGVFLPAFHETTYRYYSFIQITIFRMIQLLLGIGVPLKLVRDFNEDRSPEKALKLLYDYKEKAAQKIRFWQEVQALVTTYMDLICEGLQIDETRISISRMPSKQIIMGGINSFSDDEAFFDEYLRFRNTPHTPKQNLPFPVGGYFRNLDTFLTKPSQPTRFFSIDPKGRNQRREAFYLVGYTRGYYGQTNDLPQRMSAYAKKRGITTCGPVFNTYLLDELSIMNPDRYLLQSAAFVADVKHDSSTRSFLQIDGE